MARRKNIYRVLFTEFIKKGKKMQYQNFDIDKHIEERSKRHEQAYTDNIHYIGLSTIELNISELCNRTCSFCPRYDPKVYPNQKLFMKMSTVKKLVKELERNNWYGDIHITGFGEPHTHPKLKEIVKELKQYKKLYVEITTNGDRIVDKEDGYANKLYNYGLDMLTVDCYDGVDQYNRRIEIMKLYQGNNRLRSHEDKGDPLELMKLYGFNNRSGIMNSLEKIPKNPCYLPFYKTLIDWNGNLVLCCNDWYRKAGDLGNINETSLKEVWNSEKLNKIRTDLSVGLRKNACEKCDIVGTKYGKKSFELHQDKIKNNI